VVGGWGLYKYFVPTELNPQAQRTTELHIEKQDSIVTTDND
jgi:hypothetical protein